LASVARLNILVSQSLYENAYHSGPHDELYGVNRT
jgi:hypothetical protein